jgi:hypothetical protein
VDRNNDAALRRVGYHRLDGRDQMNQPLALLRKYDLVYIASPYSLYPGGREAACAEVSKVAGDLIIEGVKVLAPIPHSHTICEFSELDPLDHDLWMEQDEALMSACDALVVVTFTGWDNSHGIAMERDFFRHTLKRPIHFLDPFSMALS